MSIRKTLIFSAICVICASPLAGAGDYPALQQAQLGQWMAYYYVQKDTSTVNDALKLIQNSQIAEKGSVPPLAGFLTPIFSDNSNQIAAFLKGIQFTGKTKESVEAALWLAGNQNEIGLISKDNQNLFKDRKHESLLSLSPKTAGDLDEMWGAFFGSGNTAYVEKIIDVLNENTPLTGDTKMDTLTRAAAAWSLQSNIMQHKLVRRLILQNIETRTGSVKDRLQKMISDIDARKKPFPFRDGEFSAMMVLINDQNLKEFDKPSDQAMHVTELDKAKRGDIVATKIVFAGMELSNDLMADVTFDFKVLDPDGKIYDQTDLHDLAAVKARLPSRFNVFDNLSYIKIRFEPKDKLGTYKIIADIKDNVGHKKVELEKAVELTE